MKWLFKFPSYDDFLQLLAAWRFWLAGAILGSLIATLVYLISPPPYQAQAVLLVDHNVERVILEEESDNNRFYYLQQENDKLIQIAWSDDVLESVASRMGVPVSQLRSGILHLTQPGDGGWHLLAESQDPEEASAIASAWALIFYEKLQQGGPGISPLLESSLVQDENLLVERSVSMGVYIFIGSLAGTALMGFLVLFFHRKES